MTNFEHFKKRINEMSATELGTIWSNDDVPWCGNVCTEDTCVECVTKWANQTHIDPMPELKVGMMVTVSDEDEDSEIYWGIIREHKGCKIVSYDGNRGYDYIHNITINAIYDSPSFRYARCNEDTCIWRRD